MGTGLSEPVFMWSPASFTLGIAVATDVSTLVTSITLYRRAGKSTYYPWLAAIAVAHSIDLLLQFVATADPNAAMFEGQTDPGRKAPLEQVAPSTITTQLASLFFAWVGGCGFVALNMSRFRAIGAKRMPTLTKALLAATTVSILSYTSINIAYVYGYLKAFSDEDSAIVDLVDKIFSAWSVYDASTNLAISWAFVHLLRTISASSGNTLRKGFHEMLNRVTWILAVECTLMIAANGVVVFTPDFDPLWSSIYVAESARMRLFCLFLLTLSRMLKKKVVTNSAAGPNGFTATVPLGYGSQIGFPLSTLSGVKPTYGGFVTTASPGGPAAAAAAAAGAPTSSSNGMHGSSGDYVSPL
ncbi:hypothetical protein AMAG_09083 [Allomyces macrogynus ATCC 38327]|uniref:G-protein coupled receptors family 1 profile domain-containing protein n=1 Tax=Allomyces macrogynus (strain ATCC 38327) TaxID=578462 RepID=A0A0L0SNT5_ALLM3|nr:hypothetical protein AMAG_09083 [Allomyces macrogynus ATCC 38327]|eukprot:KNE64025.1 hypothetical protein AMAG_09083 [Allomyces macrogynus ATCC 38327]